MAGAKTGSFDLKRGTTRKTHGHTQSAHWHKRVVCARSVPNVDREEDKERVVWFRLGSKAPAQIARISGCYNGGRWIAHAMPVLHCTALYLATCRYYSRR